MAATQTAGTTLRAAIVGTGRIGATYDDEVVDRRDGAFFAGENRHNGMYTVLPVNHAGAYTSLPGYELVAGANRTEAKLRAFGERYGVRALYTDVHRLLREENPDVVSVCTQSAEKAEVTIAAAEAGVRAIVVEKAMATSVAEADAMVAACEKNGVFLAVNHPNRFATVNRKIKAMVEAGAIGRLGTVLAHHGGGMLHGGTHTMDAMRYFAGDVVEIDARVPDYQPEKDLPATAMLGYASGVTGFVDHVHRLQSGYELRGTDGHVTTSTLVGDGWLFKISPFYPEGAKRKYPNQVRVAPVEGEPHALSPTQRLLAELRETVLSGAPFASTGRDGLAALELCIGCYVSHLAGGPVRLPLRERDLRVPNR